MSDKKKSRKIFRLVLVPLTLAGFYLYLYFVEGKGMIQQVFDGLKWKWLAVAVAVWCLGALAYDTSLAFIRRHYQKRFPFWYVPLNSRKAHFYEMLTPGTFAFGPAAQVNSMSKQGVPVSKGISIILLQQSFNVISYILFWLICVVANFAFFRDKMSVMMWVVYLAALLFSVVIVMIYMLVPRRDGLIIAVGRLIISFISKLHIVNKEKTDKLMIKLHDHVGKLKKNMRSLDFSPFEWARGILVLTVEKFITFSVQFFVALSLGIDIQGSLFLLVAAFSMAVVISNQVAIPGGFGIHEISYFVFLMPIIGSETSLNFMMLLNRIVTYYIPLLFGGLALLIKNPGTNKTDILEDDVDGESAESMNDFISNVPEV